MYCTTVHVRIRSRWRHITITTTTTQPIALPRSYSACKLPQIDAGSARSSLPQNVLDGRQKNLPLLSGRSPLRSCSGASPARCDVGHFVPLPSPSSDSRQTLLPTYSLGYHSLEDRSSDGPQTNPSIALCGMTESYETICDLQAQVAPQPATQPRLSILDSATVLATMTASKCT
ncbi:uncharacterized protein IWZ02DRAFT_54787 [Phyllosticta citriasiana]|uniref:uncharacterized protein n=1 Tax=Phyllosticta citriasiana TaxID=595635 RepID=UPI0030FD9D37